MRYQKEILERLRQGLAAVDRDECVKLEAALAAPCVTLKIFAERVNGFYGNLLQTATKGDNELPEIGVPENENAIPYWIEDLENAVLPALRVARALS